MPSVNLAPGTQYIVAARRRRRRMYIFSWIVVLVGGLIWGGFYLYQQQLQSELDGVESRLRDVQAEIARLDQQADRVKKFETQLASLGSLFDQHIKWGTIFEGIEQLIPTPVILESMTVRAEAGQLSIVGSTTDVDQIAQTLASLQSGNDEQVFSNGEFTSVAREETTTEDGGSIVDYDFNLSFSFNPLIIREDN